MLTAEIVEKIKPSVGMRNAIVHEYIRINYDILAAAVPLALDAYSEYRKQVAGFVYDRATR
ncbi:HepT-like ribonuclease domain-containing protein [Actinopolyspora sp. H202]|uniref:HepT-like ribonuclease domain-containing protein n=1 Tax=Actinopolyspora sp. H202 TaxID=1500456 RepID=UPI003EE48694